MTTELHVPAPPPGPGVHPPFPAPPVEGRGKRLGWGLGIAAGILTLVCGGGGVALVGIAVSMTGAIQERAHTAVRGYLDALRAERFDQAYRQLCDDTREEQSLEQFRERVTEAEPITRYTLGELDVVNLSVPVSASYAGGRTAELDAYLDQDLNTGEFEVCRLAE